MSEKKRHVLSVYSQEISLFSSEGDEYMDSLAEFVDARMRSFASGAPKISFGDLCIMTALSIGDDYFKVKAKNNSYEKEKNKNEDELANHLSNEMILKAKLRESEEKLEKLETKIKDMKSSMTGKFELGEEIKQKLNVLSYELRKPLNERTYEKSLNDAKNLVESE